MKKKIPHFIIVILLILNLGLLSILKDTAGRVEDLQILYLNTKRHLQNKNEEISYLKENYSKKVCTGILKKSINGPNPKR